MSEPIPVNELRRTTAVLPEPSGVVYHPNTFRGKVAQIANKAKDTYGRYFQGKDPVIMTKPEEEASKK